MKKYSLIVYVLFTIIIISQPLTIGINTSTSTNPYPCAMDVTILYVGGSGAGNYTSIQEAIDVANPGDTVYVYDDSSPYLEHLTITEAITLQGENQTTTIIDGSHTGDLITIQADDATIQGFTLINSGDDWPRCTAIRIHADHTTLSQLTCQHTQTAVILTASTGSTITDCTILYNEVGIFLENSSTGNLIKDNTVISSSFEYQIAVISCPGNTIQGNIITNPDDFGIYVYDSPGTHLLENTITGCEEGIVFVSSNTSEITDNTLQDNTVYGISIGVCTGLIISGNTFTHDGLFLYQCHDNTITDNTVNGAPLVYLENAYKQKISSNAGQIILVNCTNLIIQDAIIQDVCIAVQCWDCTNCVIIDNVLTLDLCSIYLSGCSHTDISTNILSESHWNIFFYLMYIADCDQTTVTNNNITFTNELSTIYATSSNTIVFTQNIIHGERSHAYNSLSCGYSNDITITDNTIESGDIELAVCTKATVQGNTLQSGAIGCDSSRNIRVICNDIHPKNGGIFLRGMIRTTLRDNTITNGTQAVSLERCLFTNVIGNSFIDCGDIPATFTNSLRNTWMHNYWGSTLFHPKIIRGAFEIIINDFPPTVITIPMINIDKIPKLLP